MSGRECLEMSVASESQLAPGPDLAPVLVGLLRREGSGLLDRRGRLNGLLRDYAPAAIRDIRLLLAAFDAGAPGRLKAASDPLEAGMLAEEAERLVEQFGCSRALALNAVETWGRALVGSRGPAIPVRAAAPVSAVAAGGLQAPDEDRPGPIGRWGGIAVGVLLVLVAVARWLGLL